VTKIKDTLHLHSSLASRLQFLNNLVALLVVETTRRLSLVERLEGMAHGLDIAVKKASAVSVFINMLN